MDSTFFISYDLSEGSKGNYDDLKEDLEDLNALPVQYSLWVLKSDYTAEQLRDKLKKFFPAKKDRLIVIKEADWSGYNSINQVSDL